MYNKKAAIGAAMTWVVATIIILLVIILFVYSAGILRRGSIEEGLASRYRPTGSTKEQMLLALLETKIEGGKVKDIIINSNNKEDYNNLRQKIKPIIEKFPKQLPLEGDWVFIVYEGNKNKLQIGTKAKFRDSSPSIVYVKDKKIELSFEKLESLV